MKTRQDIEEWWNALTWRDRASILGHRYVGAQTRMPIFAKLDGEQTLIAVRYYAEGDDSCQSSNQSEPSAAAC